MIYKILDFAYERAAGAPYPLIPPQAGTRALRPGHDFRLARAKPGRWALKTSCGNFPMMK
jgi:hypothetical protein